MSEGQVDYLTSNLIAEVIGLAGQEEQITGVIDRYVPGIFHENHHTVLIIRRMVTIPAMEAMRDVGQYLVDPHDPEGGKGVGEGEALVRPSSFCFHTRRIIKREMKHVLDVYTRLKTGLALDHVEHAYHYILISMSALAATEGEGRVSPPRGGRRAMCAQLVP